MTVATPSRQLCAGAERVESASNRRSIRSVTSSGPHHGTASPRNAAETTSPPRSSACMEPLPPRPPNRSATLSRWGVSTSRPTSTPSLAFAPFSVLLNHGERATKDPSSSPFCHGTTPYLLRPSTSAKKFPSAALPAASAEDVESSGGSSRSRRAQVTNRRCDPTASPRDATASACLGLPRRTPTNPGERAQNLPFLVLAVVLPAPPSSGSQLRTRACRRPRTHAPPWCARTHSTRGRALGHAHLLHARPPSPARCRERRGRDRALHAPATLIPLTRRGFACSPRPRTRTARHLSTHARPLWTTATRRTTTVSALPCRRQRPGLEPT